jgi:hypothetical protein
MPMARLASQPDTPTAVASLDGVKAWLGIGMEQSAGGDPVLSSSDRVKAFCIPRAGHG